MYEDEEVEYELNLEIYGFHVGGDYSIDDKLKHEITFKESKEDIEKYFDKLALCNEFGICFDCGQPVMFDPRYDKNYIKEYNISSLCRECQNKTFGF